VAVPAGSGLGASSANSRIEPAIQKSAAPRKAARKYRGCKGRVVMVERPQKAAYVPPRKQNINFQQWAKRRIGVRFCRCGMLSFFARPRLASRIRPFLLRRLKKDVAADLPAKIAVGREGAASIRLVISYPLPSVYSPKRICCDLAPKLASARARL